MANIMFASGGNETLGCSGTQAGFLGPFVGAVRGTRDRKRLSRTLRRGADVVEQSFEARDIAREPGVPCDVAGKAAQRGA
jgi:hypothetical protein